MAIRWLMYETENNGKQANQIFIPDNFRIVGQGVKRNVEGRLKTYEKAYFIICRSRQYETTENGESYRVIKTRHQLYPLPPTARKVKMMRKLLRGYNALNTSNLISKNRTNN